MYVCMRERGGRGGREKERGGGEREREKLKLTWDTEKSYFHSMLNICNYGDCFEIRRLIIVFLSCAAYIVTLCDE